MSRHIILEVRGLSGAVASPGPRAPREGYSGDGEVRAGIIAGGLTMSYGEAKENFQAARGEYRGLVSDFKTLKKFQNINMKLQKSYGGLGQGRPMSYTGEKWFKQARAYGGVEEHMRAAAALGVSISPREDIKSVEPKLAEAEAKVSAARAAKWQAFKDDKVLQKNILPKASIAIAYANQVYGLVTAHHQNTYKMSGMTAASLRLKRQQDIVNISRDLAGIGIAFAINPVLGLAQTAMTTAQKAVNLYEQTREYNFNQAKERYTSNYYRSRLVNNTKVVL